MEIRSLGSLRAAARSAGRAESISSFSSSSPPTDQAIDARETLGARPPERKILGFASPSTGAGDAAAAPRSLARPQRPAAGGRLDGISDTLRRALEIVRTSHVDDTPLPTLTASALGSLRRVDPSVQVEARGAHPNAEIILHHSGKEIGRYPAPPDVDAQLDVMGRAVDALAARSRRIAHLPPADLRALLVAGMTEALDPYSRLMSAGELASLTERLQPRAVREAGAAALQDPLAFQPSVSISVARYTTAGGDEGEVPVLRIDAFTATTAVEVMSALAALGEGEVESLIVDLRGNGGGLTGAAPAVADLFVAEGTTFDLRARNPEFTDRHIATPGHPFERTAVVLLVDESTASAAEAFAAALADRGRAVVVGATPTRGKGSAQWVATLPSGEGLAVTTGRFVGPSGAPIEGVGILPAVCGAAPRDQAIQELQRAAGSEDPLAGARFAGEERAEAILATHCPAPAEPPADGEDPALLTAVTLAIQPALYARATERQRAVATRPPNR